MRIKLNRNKVSGFIIAAAALIIMVAAILAGASTALADPGETQACGPGCHNYPAASLRVSTDPTTKSVSTNAEFDLVISWSGGASYTEVNWPNTLDNTQFSPSPRIPYSGTASSGSTTSTLTAPSNPGTYTVRVYVAKPSPRETYYQDVTVTVAAAPVPLSITTTSLPAGTAGTAYNQSLAATGGTTPYSWSLSTGALPTGLTLGSGGAITGIPTAAGSSNFTAMVTDNSSATATKPLSITISAAPVPLSITTTSLPVGTAGTAYNQSLAATGGTTPYSWSLSASALPTGLTLGSGGAITGMPTAAGSSNFTAMVTDNASATATKPLSITINAAVPVPLSITTTSLPVGTAGTAYNQSLAATGGTTPYSWSLSASALPTGLTLGSGGAITGMPTAAGSSNFTAMVTDNASATATKPLSITINAAVPVPLSITTTSLPAGTVGTAYNQSLAATGGTTPYRWTLSTGILPTGLLLGSDGAITGIPETTGTYGFFVSVTDNVSTTVTQPLSIAINLPGADSAGPLTTKIKARLDRTTSILTLSANISDATTGGSNIAAAEYFLATVSGNGTGTTMSASDGSFDSVTEAVMATVNMSGVSTGSQTFYVHGKDAAGNWGPTSSVVVQIRTAPPSYDDDKDRDGRHGDDDDDDDGDRDGRHGDDDDDDDGDRDGRHGDNDGRENGRGKSDNGEHRGYGQNKHTGDQELSRGVSGKGEHRGYVATTENQRSTPSVTVPAQRSNSGSGNGRAAGNSRGGGRSKD